MKEKKFLIKVIGKTVYESKINTISYIIINIILSVMLMGTTVIYDSLTKLMDDTVSNNIDCRTLYVNNYDTAINRDISAELVKNADPHIIACAFQDNAFTCGYIPELKTAVRDGQAYIYGCNEITMPALTNRLDNLPENYIIIPEKFYADRSYETEINGELYVNGAEYVGKEVTVSMIVEHFDGETITEVGTAEHGFIVAGTYDSAAAFTDDNVCFTSFDNVGLLNDIADDGSIERAVPHILAYVDHAENVGTVITRLSDMGYEVSVRKQMNTAAPRVIKRVTDTICLAVYVFCIMLSVVVLLGMIKKSRSKIALMKSLGYSKGSIFKIYLAGYGLLILGGYLIGSIIAAVSALLIKGELTAADAGLSKLDLVFSANAVLTPLVFLVMMPIFALMLIWRKIGNISSLELWVGDGV